MTVRFKKRSSLMSNSSIVSVKLLLWQSSILKCIKIKVTARYSSLLAFKVADRGSNLRHASSFSAWEYLEMRQALCSLVCSSMCKKHLFQRTVIRGIRDLFMEAAASAHPPRRSLVAICSGRHQHPYTSGNLGGFINCPCVALIALTWFWNPCFLHVGAMRMCVTGNKNWQKKLHNAHFIKVALQSFRVSSPLSIQLQHM